MAAQADKQPYHQRRVFRVVSPSAAARRVAREVESQVCKAERFLLGRLVAPCFISTDFPRPCALARTGKANCYTHLSGVAAKPARASGMLWPT